MNKIRRFEEKDVRQIIKIGKSVKEFKVSDTSVFWPEKLLERWLKSSDDVMLVAENSDKIIGFVFFAYHTPTTKAVLENIWVDSVNRKTGLAEELFNEGMNRLKNIGCTYVVGFVSEKNQVARNFFINRGLIEKEKVIWIDTLIK